jgi:omega-6 fatty acid desaturase (delta-12 desaturase)
LTILAGYGTVFLCGMCLYPLVVRPREHADAALALLVHAALLATLAAFAPALLLWALLLPLCVAMAVGSYLFYAQHNFPSARFEERGAWDYATAALAGSSYIPMGPVMRWFTGNIG